jgi:ribosomal protein L37AE/L43A
MPTFPRSQNGWTDNGDEVGPRHSCPNCGSDKYRVTVSTESCSACGLEYSYWNPVGGNAIYDALVARRERQEEEREQRRLQAEREADEWGYE